MDWKQYNSKKFVVIMSVIVITFILALLGKVTPPVAGILTGLSMVYPAAQGFIDSKKLDK